MKNWLAISALSLGLALALLKQLADSGKLVFGSEQPVLILLAVMGRGQVRFQPVNDVLG